MHFTTLRTKAPAPKARKILAILGLSMLTALSACSDSDSDSDSDELTGGETVNE